MKKIIPFLFILLLAACEQPIDWEIFPEENNRPVVEAILTDEFKQQEIRLSRSFSELNEPPPPITDAMVRVTANDKTVRFFHQPDEPGLYRTREEVRLIRNLTYELEIVIDNERYFAENELSEVVPIPEINFHYRKNPDSLLYSDSLVLADFAPPFNPNQQAMYVVLVDWRHISGDDDSLAKMVFYTLSSVDVSEVIPAPKSEVFFPAGSIVTVEKYGLSEDFADFIRAVALETDWNGNLFYNSGSNVPTNISNGGLGFFGACAFLRKRVIAR